MKKFTTLALSSILPLTLFAKDIKLSEKDQKNWDIQTKILKKTETLPLGSYVVEITTPPTLLHTISLPFDAQVLSLNVATYQKVDKGELLATVTGPEWISIQKDTIADAIELRHHQHLAERKQKLCREEIIPKKECTAANAELKTDRIQLSASKALLKSFGASKSIIENLLRTLEIKSKLPIMATSTGTISTLNAQPGKTTDASKALFVIQTEGDLWIESDMPITAALSLKEGETVTLDINGKSYQSQVLQLAPSINAQNQSRHVRFSLKNTKDLLAGMRSEATIVLNQTALRVPKKALIKESGKTILFTKENGIYHDRPVTIIAEDADYYYIKDDTNLHQPVAISSIAILKSMLGAEDE